MSLQGAYRRHTSFMQQLMMHNTRAMQYSKCTAQTQDLRLVNAVYTDARVDGIEPLKMHAFAKLA